LFNRRDHPSCIAPIGTARMRGLGEIDLMQPNVIWGRRRCMGLKLCNWNAAWQMQSIGEKNHWDASANFFLRSQKYLNPNARWIAAGYCKGQACGLIFYQQSTCINNQISKRQIPCLLGLNFIKAPSHSALMIDDICAGA
jgi:hypothetical protein